MSFLREPGDLRTTPLAAILLEVWNLRLSGALTVDQGGGSSRLYFRDGVPVGAQVFAGFRPLGHFLLAKGIIDIGILDRCLVEMARAHRPQGEILVEMGAIDRDTLDQVLSEQQTGYLALIAALQDGGYRFDPAEPVPEWTRGIRIQPLRAIVDALAAPQAGALVSSAIGQVGGAVAVGPGYADLAASFGWSEAEDGLVARMAHPAAPEAQLLGSPLPSERSRAVLAALVLLGLADSTAAAEGGARAEEGEGVVDLADIAVAGPPILVPVVLAPSPPPERPPVAAAPTAPVHGASVPVAAPQPAPSPAPAAGAGPTPAPIGKRSDPDEARARRQRLLARAMQNMGVGPLASPQPTRPGASSSGPVRSGEARGGSHAGDPAEAALRRALEFVAPRAREKDLFARLGLPKTAGVDDVKAAYHQMVRQFHPDKYAAPSLADLQPALQELLSTVNEAYTTLSDKTRRSEYLARTAAGGGAASQADADTARVDAQKAEACYRTRDYGKARLFFEAAIRGDPRAEYHAALAAVLIADPKAPDRARVKELLAEATKDPGCDRGFFLAGLVARQDGEEARAEKMFRAALKANPRNADAARELKLLEGRRREAAEERGATKK